MLILRRKAHQRIRIGSPDSPIWITVIDWTSNRNGEVRLGIEAAYDIAIVREEVIDDSDRKQEKDSAK